MKIYWFLKNGKEEIKWETDSDVLPKAEEVVYVRTLKGRIKCVVIDSYHTFFISRILNFGDFEGRPEIHGNLTHEAEVILEEEKTN